MNQEIDKVQHKIEVIIETPTNKNANTKGCTNITTIIDNNSIVNINIFTNKSLKNYSFFLLTVRCF